MLYLYLYLYLDSTRVQLLPQGITPIWYLYAMASVQLLQVVNTSLNLPIYWLVGNFRETCLDCFGVREARVHPRYRYTILPFLWHASDPTHWVCPLYTCLLHQPP